MLKTLLSFITLTLSLTANAQQQRDESWQLVWHDEFDGTGLVDNGGHIQPDAFPMRYEIDYVRVYQKK